MDNWKQSEKHVGRGLAYGLIGVLALVAALVVWSTIGRTSQNGLVAEPAAEDGAGSDITASIEPGEPLTETEAVVAALEAMRLADPATGTPVAMDESSVQARLDAMHQADVATGTPMAVSESSIRSTLEAMSKESSSMIDNKAVAPSE